MVTRDEVFAALAGVADPELGKDIVALRMVDDVVVEGATVSFTLNLTTPACPLRNRIETGAREAVASLEGVKEVKMKTSSTVFATRDYSKTETLRGVRNVIAIASGKGGVGKSTVAVNIAAALAATGASVGILDADIYGPNVPHMMGLKQDAQVKDNLIIPPIAFGVKVASLGFFYRDETPLIWRGPMVAGAVRQLITQVDWGDLDYLICDLPPGTGDSPLTLAQTVPLGGVVIITTPQEAALSIASKSLAMFRRLNIPILGVVENMSYFVCPHCGERVDVFSTGGGRKMAQNLDAQFLGEIPLDVSIREQSDLGAPIVCARPDSHQANAFKDVAFRLAGMVSIVAFSKGGT